MSDGWLKCLQFANNSVDRSWNSFQKYQSSQPRNQAPQGAQVREDTLTVEETEEEIVYDFDYVNTSFEWTGCKIIWLCVVSWPVLIKYVDWLLGIRL
jgi:hypothetical protein